MQQWNEQIRLQLNDLPGFPPTPTGSPAGTAATELEWILGDWIAETRVRPAVADVASLPASGNEVGDVRIVDANQSWYYWNGVAWVPMGTGGAGPILSVTGTAPINVTGGPNPIVSHDASGVVAGTYGDDGTIPQVTVDAKGHVTAVAAIPISPVLPSIVLGTGPIQTISANTDQITPVAALHRIQTNGVNHTLSSTPTINMPGAVLGQVVYIQNVDPAHSVTLQKGGIGDHALSLSNANTKIDKGGTIMLVFNGSLWVEVSHTESTST